MRVLTIVADVVCWWYFYSRCIYFCVLVFFFFQAEDGIRDLVRSRGLGDVYKRQVIGFLLLISLVLSTVLASLASSFGNSLPGPSMLLSLIHI